MIAAKIYVRFVDGTNVYIPVDARFVSDNIYQILPDSEFDYDDDATLFEFGPQDIVKVKSQQLAADRSVPVAYELVTVGEKNNLQKRLLFYILMNEPNPQDLLDGVSQQDIASLMSKINEASFMYPTIKEWFPSIGRQSKT